MNPLTTRTFRQTRLTTMLLSVAALTATVVAEDINVPADFASIQGAINAASDGDQIIVAPGQYIENINTWGKGITIRSTDPSSPEIVAQTIIDAGGEGSVIRIISGERLDTVIDGFTITGGNATKGGGIEIALSDPIIRRCVFIENQGQTGGAVYAYVSSALFDECHFVNNTAIDGGAVAHYSTTRLRYDDCIFESNTAADGGAINNFFADVRLRRCIVRDNTATNRGGAYDGRESRLTINSSLVVNNTAPRAGAFYIDDDGIRARNSTIVSNVATEQDSNLSAGFFSTLIFSNCIVRDHGPNPIDTWLSSVFRFSNTDIDNNGDGTIDADPLFVDPANGDYRLQAASPSADAGFNGWISSYDTRDLDGAPRLQDGTVDHGAYEVSGSFDPPVVASGQIAAITKDDGSLAYGIPQPLWLYDLATESWTELIRDLPAFAIAADTERECFWIQAGDTGFLGCVPWNTMELEEIGIPRLVGELNGPSISGLAVRHGVIYATSAFGGNVYTINPVTAEMTEVAEISNDYDLWDIEYDAANDRLLLLSSSGSLPNDQLGVIAFDLDTLELNTIQQWFNENPSDEAPALQGLAAGGGQHFIFRPLYNDLEIYDADSLLQTGAISLPGGNSWVLGGLTWTAGLDGAALMTGDTNGDCVVNVDDLLTLLEHFGQADAMWNEGDFDGNGLVNVDDLLILLAHFGDECSP